MEQSRITEHPILEVPEYKMIGFYFNGKHLEARG